MRLSVTLRLVLGFGVILSLMVLLTVIGTNSVSLIDKEMTVINDVNSVKQRHAINFRGSVHDRAIAIRDVVLLDNDAEVSDTIKVIRKLETFYSESAGPLDDLISAGSTNEEKEILSIIKQVEQRTLPLVEQIIQLRQSGNATDAKKILLSSAKPAFIDWLAIINRFIDYQEAQNQAETLFVRQTTSSFSGLMMAFTGGALLLGIVVSFLIIRGLRKSLGGEPHYIADILLKMADGDLTQKITTEDKDSVLDSLGRLQNQLQTTISGISSASGQINTQTDNTSENSEALVKLSNQQNDFNEQAYQNLESVKTEANTVSELLQHTRENSHSTMESSTKGNQSVQKAASTINEVSNTVNSAVERLHTLEQRTKEITGITNTISEISEQTNLLALNAAIEAARAGESGRGFAVVADEVRSLANRTGNATSEIESMLTEIQQETSKAMDIMSNSLPQIQQSLELSGESSDLLKVIEEQARESLSNVEQVVGASATQISVLDELYQSMDGVVDTARKMGDVSSNFFKANQDSAAGLNELAVQLKDHADYFKVG